MKGYKRYDKNIIRLPRQYVNNCLRILKKQRDFISVKVRFTNILPTMASQMLQYEDTCMEESSVQVFCKYEE